MRYVCVHGHFYQPPRENPSLEAIEMQDSAYPYHDWNERVTAECYAPNATRAFAGRSAANRRAGEQLRADQLQFRSDAAALDGSKRPRACWTRSSRPTRQASERFGGHGSAIAQAYNHMILPLAHPRDKETQVNWGIRDFEHRFGRKPEGMWLPETAVDIVYARSSRGAGNSVHDSRATPGEARAPPRQPQLERRFRRSHRSQPRIPGEAPFEENDRAFSSTMGQSRKASRSRACSMMESDSRIAC